MKSPNRRSAIVAVLAAFAFIACLFAFLFFNPLIHHDNEFIPVAKTSSANSHVFTVTVMDSATSRPLAQAQVNLSTNNARNQKFTTDDKGVVAIPLPAKAPTYFSVTARFPHHVPTNITFLNNPENPPQPIPASYTLSLPPGTIIGGIIQNPDGTPIAGATVYLLVPSPYGRSGSHVSISDLAIQTDGKGHWSTDIMPAEIPDLLIRLKHPDYASDSMYGQTPRPPMEKLRDQTAVMIMHPGIVVAGRVTDSAGKPIARASVKLGRDRWGSNYPSAKTDDQGRYSFKNAPAGELILTVQAKGFSPDLKTLTIQPNQPDIDFQLTPGHVLKGHVVDPAGKPIPHANINADTWRGDRSIEWQSTTDDEGAFTWTSAPGDAVLYNAYAMGYSYNRNATLTAGPPDVDNKVVLTLPLTVHVTVTDADTHQPITHYQLLQGIDWGNGQAPYWERRQQGSLVHPEGKSEFTITENYPGHAVRIEADGYAPADSRVFTDKESLVDLAFQLHKAADLSAIVLTPEGKPATDAVVGLAILPYGIQVENGLINQQDDRPITHTDATGKFSFPPQSPPFKLVLTHNTGFAILTPDQISPGKSITLEPWAHIQGTLKIGAHPAGGEVVQGWYSGPNAQYHPDQPNVMFSVRSTTDIAGQFNFDRVPPGELRLGRQIKLSNQMTSFTQGSSLILKPGDSANITIGGTGRPVTGHVVIPPDIAVRSNWILSRAGLANDAHSSRPKFPDNFKTMTQEEKKKWMEDWQKSAEGKAFMIAQQNAAANRKSFPFALNPDGSFRIDDVPAGTYQLAVAISDAANPRNGPWGKQLAAGTLDVTIPDMPGGRSDDPLELPPLTLTALPAGK
ncbi:MAG TPA: carboxypeptidase regulatory-like domain-containing protein [Tepidisphaeraceae bacterium]|jgi:protocatechuate 3,4-dioxygenase beta subunit|nr:carboxypeptidase regulatory-like domain-containing protein [Tepidisphaeraceae bacterium]